jgi:hypothetical protein
MPRKLPPKPGEKPQFERFLETARQIGAEDTDAVLKNTVRKVAHSSTPNANSKDSRRKAAR